MSITAPITITATITIAATITITALITTTAPITKQALTCRGERFEKYPFRERACDPFSKILSFIF